jgi:hypothetical protein
VFSVRPGDRFGACGREAPPCALGCEAAVAGYTMLGFRGHFVTKSRGSSTTLGGLRAARAAYRGRKDEPGELGDDDSTPVVAFWQYLGSRYLNPG